RLDCRRGCATSACRRPSFPPVPSSRFRTEPSCSRASLPPTRTSCSRCTVPPIKDEVIVAPAAQENGLALMLGELIREHLASRPGKRRDLEALDGRVGIVARDAGVSLTLDFRHGVVVVHDGLLPRRQLTITTDAERITSFSLIDIQYGLPVFHDQNGQGVVRDLLGGATKIQGLLRHPLSLVRLTRLMSVHS